MAIELKDIRTAVRVYLNTKVAGSISAFTPAVPGTINPNEGFTFSVTAKNAASADGGIALNNVRYHLRVANPAVAKLIVPAATTGIAKSALDQPNLTPGTQVTEMFLFPLGEKNRLTAGETDTISGLSGKAGVLGNTEIKLDIFADPDLDFLFPKDENSATFNHTVSVV